jgi:hypothetical protein
MHGLPGVVPEEVARLSLECIGEDPDDCFALLARCPLGSHPPHALRCKPLEGGLVDLFCLGGCNPNDVTAWCHKYYIEKKLEEVVEGKAAL